MYVTYLVTETSKDTAINPQNSAENRNRGGKKTKASSQVVERSVSAEFQQPLKRHVQASYKQASQKPGEDIGHVLEKANVQLTPELRQAIVDADDTMNAVLPESKQVVAPSVHQAVVDCTTNRQDVLRTLETKALQFLDQYNTDVAMNFSNIAALKQKCIESIAALDCAKTLTQQERDGIVGKNDGLKDLLPAATDKN